MTSSVGMIIPNIWKNKKCSKPPTSYNFNTVDLCSCLLYPWKPTKLVLWTWKGHWPRHLDIPPVFSISWTYKHCFPYVYLQGCSKHPRYWTHLLLQNRSSFSQAKQWFWGTQNHWETGGRALNQHLCSAWTFHCDIPGLVICYSLLLKPWPSQNSEFSHEKHGDMNRLIGGTYHI